MVHALFADCDHLSKKIDFNFMLGTGKIERLGPVWILQFQGGKNP
jgi:hypothetical protein